jgi:3-dehydroquinate synthase
VRRDEKESSLRAILNFGHTLGHAIETLSGFDAIKHGEAVAMGMVFATHLSASLGHSNKDEIVRAIDIISSYGLPVTWPAFKPKAYADVMRKDKKAGSKNIKFILLKKIGKVDIVPLTIEEIVKWL